MSGKFHVLQYMVVFVEGCMDAAVLYYMADRLDAGWTGKDGKLDLCSEDKADGQSHIMLICFTLKTKSWSKWVKRLVATGHRVSVGNIGHNSSSD